MEISFLHQMQNAGNQSKNVHSQKIWIWEMVEDIKIIDKQIKFSQWCKHWSVKKNFFWEAAYFKEGLCKGWKIYLTNI